MKLRDFTMARVELARAGNSLATDEVLRFQLAHAMARDAIHVEMDTVGLQSECKSRAWATHLLRSAAADRACYLRRPDLGRQLDRESAESLAEVAGPFDLVVVLADGLSSLAVNRHAINLLDALFPMLDAAAWHRAPLMLVQQGRVAIGDEIGEAVKAAMTLMLIGERPGLSSPDSLGAYLTWHPTRGRTDAERNCVSNIRTEGISYAEAAQRIFGLLINARTLQLSGIALKDTAVIATTGLNEVPCIGPVDCFD